jgi:hypothetical protein
MHTEGRFATEIALFDLMLPELLRTSAHKWFVAWDGRLQAIVETLADACEILDQQPENVDVMVREISSEEIRLPLMYAATK